MSGLVWSVKYLKAEYQTTKNESHTHRAREVARYLANVGHIGIRSTMNNKINAFARSVWH